MSLEKKIGNQPQWQPQRLVKINDALPFPRRSGGYGYYPWILSVVFIWGINGQRTLANNVCSAGDLDGYACPEVITVAQSPSSDVTAQVSTPVEAMYVREIRVVDSTVFTQEDFAPLLTRFQGRELTREEIKQVSDAVTQLYLNRNYLNSRGVALTPADGEGILIIRVIEGRLAKIDIRGTQRVSVDYVRSRIELANTVPLNTVKLEEQLRLLRLDPLFKNIEASLRPTGVEGESLLVVKVQENEPFKSSLLIDNYSPVSVGGERLGLEMNYRNLTGVGDTLSTSYYRTFTGGSQSWDLSYQMPVNPRNGTVGVRIAPGRTKITEEPFKGLNIEGEQQLYEINYRQPLWRSPSQEFAVSLGFTHQHGQTFLENDPRKFGIGPDENGVSRTSVFRFSQDYLKRDRRGLWFGRSQFNLGVGLLDATINQDDPDSRFFSWSGQVVRSQFINDHNLLLIRADWQWAANSLLTSQQFAIGGAQSLRGYRQNIRTGDNGLLVSAEDRITIQRDEGGLPIMQLAPFLDMGVVWNQPDNPNKLPKDTFLVGTGLGLLWNQALGINGLRMRLDYAIPLVDSKVQGNNIQDKGFYFGLQYQP